jgi:hypothetical protein
MIFQDEHDSCSILKNLVNPVQGLTTVSSLSYKPSTMFSTDRGHHADWHHHHTGGGAIV